MIQLSVKEAIIPAPTKNGSTDRDLELVKLRSVLDRCGVVVTERKQGGFVLKNKRDVSYKLMHDQIGEFVSKNFEQNLSRLIVEPSSGLDVSLSIRLYLIISFCEWTLNVFIAELSSASSPAPSAANALLSYLQLLSDPANYNSFTLKTHDLAQYMKLDASAMRALGLFGSDVNFTVQFFNAIG